MVCHRDVELGSEWIETGKNIGVDSAMAGIFDASVFGRDEAISYKVNNIYEIEMDEEGMKYYVACSDIIASSDDEAGIVAGGTVSMSGIGDGYYPVFVQYNDQNEIVAVLLEFYIEDEEEWSSKRLSIKEVSYCFLGFTLCELKFYSIYNFSRLL